MIGCIVSTMPRDWLVSEIKAGVWDTAFRSGDLPQSTERR